MEAMNLRKIKEGRKYRRQRLNSHTFRVQETSASSTGQPNWNVSGCGPKRHLVDGGFQAIATLKPSRGTYRRSVPIAEVGRRMIGD